MFVLFTAHARGKNFAWYTSRHARSHDVYAPRRAVHHRARLQPGVTNTRKARHGVTDTIVSFSETFARVSSFLGARLAGMSARTVSPSLPSLHSLSARPYRRTSET